MPTCRVAVQVAPPSPTPNSLNFSRVCVDVQSAEGMGGRKSIEKKLNTERESAY
jgi:hypothetical protein